METWKIPQKDEQKILKLLATATDILTVSEKNHGKTVSAMALCNTIQRNNLGKNIIFETFPKWQNEYANATYLEIPSDWIRQTSNTINLENVWIKHDKAFTVLHGDILKQFLRTKGDLIFTVSSDDIEAIAFFIYSVIYSYYRKRYDCLRHGLKPQERIYFTLEECQNSLSSQTLSSKLFNRYKKLWSEMRNFNLVALCYTQRLQDINTYFRCRASLGLGKISLDDYELKIKKLLSSSAHKATVLNLSKGSFFYTAINDIIHYEPIKMGKAKEFKYALVDSKPQVKKLTFWEKLVYFPLKPTPATQEDTEESEYDGAMTLDESDILFPSEE